MPIRKRRAHIIQTNSREISGKPNNIFFSKDSHNYLFSFLDYIRKRSFCFAFHVCLLWRHRSLSTNNNDSNNSS